MIPRMLLLIGLALFCAAPADADGDFALLDTNRDGTVSRDEAGWQPVVSANFDRADADRDGTLSRPEFAAFEINSGREARARKPQSDEGEAAAKVLAK